MIVGIVFKRKKTLLAISMKISKNARNAFINMKFIACIHAQYARTFNFVPNAMEGQKIIIHQIINL
jgi:hypothetical protein